MTTFQFRAWLAGQQGDWPTNSVRRITADNVDEAWRKVRRAKLANGACWRLEGQLRKGA